MKFYKITEAESMYILGEYIYFCYYEANTIIAGKFPISDYKRIEISRKNARVHERLEINEKNNRLVVLDNDGERDITYNINLDNCSIGNRVYGDVRYNNNCILQYNIKKNLFHPSFRNIENGIFKLEQDLFIQSEADKNKTRIYDNTNGELLLTFDIFISHIFVENRESFYIISDDVLYHVSNPVKLVLPGIYQPDSILNEYFEQHFLHEKRIWRKINEFI